MIELTEIGFIAPHLMGLDVGLRLGTRDMRNLFLLEITVANKGPSDAVDPTAADEAFVRKRPRIDFPANIKVPQMPWLHTPFETAGDVRVTAKLQDDGQKRQSVAIHIHHLGGGTKVKHRLIATSEVERPTATFSLQREEIEFFPGAIPNVGIVAQGLLENPPAHLKI